MHYISLATLLTPVKIVLLSNNLSLYDDELIKECYTKIEKMVFAFKGKDVEIEFF